MNKLSFLFSLMTFRLSIGLESAEHGGQRGCWRRRLTVAVSLEPPGGGQTQFICDRFAARHPAPTAVHVPDD